MKLAFDDTGTPPGSGRTAVLFLHGLGDDRSTWRRFVEPLSRERRVVTLDFRGHGRSAHPAGGYAFGDYVADAIGLCDELVRVPVVAVGHSLGGAVALTMAQTRPELIVGLVLEDPRCTGTGAGPPRPSSRCCGTSPGRCRNGRRPSRSTRWHWR
ncbi:MAG TPA: alpha/beta hydrolase [Acidimicrobiales bacterium]|nr:alpha/beta hydrolase [Acidimicrobiales bacterium]